MERGSVPRWPDFLVIGAAKGGTTALFKALCRHPRIYEPTIKEPRYLRFPDSPPRFNGLGSPGAAKTIVSDRTAYLALFAGCPAGMITGEASTDYLAHAPSAALAHELVPHARLIVMLRHPVERAHSQYLHIRHMGHEPSRSFEEAWHASDARMAAGWRDAFWHRHRAFYARHLRAWLDHFPREQLLILFYEDWRARPAEVLAQAWRHLGLEPMAEPVITQDNITSRAPRWAWLHHHMMELDNPFRRLAQRVLPLRARDAVTRSVAAINLRPGPRLDPAVRARLARTYHDDLTELEALVGRDLTAWRS